MVFWLFTPYSIEASNSLAVLHYEIVVSDQYDNTDLQTELTICG